MSDLDDDVIYEPVESPAELARGHVGRLLGNALGSGYADPQLAAAGVEQIPDDIHRTMQLGREPNKHQKKRMNNAIKRAMAALRAKHLAERAALVDGTDIQPREPRFTAFHTDGRLLRKRLGRT